MQIRRVSDLRDGYQDGLEPLKALDITECSSVGALVRRLHSTAFGARRVGQAADVLEAMIKDSKCFAILTVSGAMTVAKMGLLIAEMIEMGWINAMVTTGALMAHGLAEDSGLQHFKCKKEGWTDSDYFRAGYNRVYDTVELEANLINVETLMVEAIQNCAPPLHSARLFREMGRLLKHCAPTSRGILQSAYKRSVPIYVPAFSDSELGLNFALYNRSQVRDGKSPTVFNPFVDLEKFTEQCIEAETLGIFTIGGGVPRNWAQQVAPYVDELSSVEPNRQFIDESINRRFKYAVRICPESTHLGGLSGCTYSEGVSWGKFIPTSDGGEHAEVYSDATIVWPLIVRAVVERLVGTEETKDGKDGTSPDT